MPESKSERLRLQNKYERTYAKMKAARPANAAMTMEPWIPEADEVVMVDGVGEDPGAVPFLL